MTAGPGAPRLVLASGSPARAAMLRAAGLDFSVDPADLDEAAIEAECRAAGENTPEVAASLAGAKACFVSRRHGGALVLGADQMLDLDGETLRKPGTRAAARETLARLAGRPHELISAAALARAGDPVLACVGAYQLEGLGGQLFSHVEGDYFTVLGLPLLAVLEALRGFDDAPAGLLT